MFSPKTIRNLAIYLGMPAVGGATSLLTAKVATQFGHSFMQIGPQSLLLLGTIDTVNNFASFQLYIYGNDYFNFENGDYLTKFTKGMILASAITGTVLFALSALAARVNLISAGLTPFGGAALIVTGFIGNYLTAKGAQQLIDQANAGQKATD